MEASTLSTPLATYGKSFGAENGYLCIENEGEVELNAILLLGASSKRDDKTKIGYFGSGMKYAIAVMLREGIPFRIFAGESEIKINTQRTDFRGKEFQVIKVNNRHTSLTTEMGIDWEPWFALREIFCNAIDEGGSGIDVVLKDAELKGIKGKTRIYIQAHPSLMEVLENWGAYFSEGRKEDAVLMVGTDKIFDGRSNELIIYRKGIRVHHEPKKCIYHYDMDWIDINESRVIESQWTFNHSLATWWARYASLDMVETLYRRWRDTYEKDLPWGNTSVYSDIWLDALHGKPICIHELSGYYEDEQREESVVLPSNLANALKERFGNKVRILGQKQEAEEKRELVMNERQRKIVEEAKEFLAHGDVVVPYEIRLKDFGDRTTFAEADTSHNVIYLSPRVFDHGKRQVVAAVFEEFLHLDTLAEDKSRRFQNELINMFIKVVEKKAGIYL